MTQFSATARLHHRVDGPEGAPVLVLGPSLGTTLDLWNPQLPELSRHCRVVRYDLRGHGGSQAPAGPYSIAALAGDMLALLDRLGVDRFSYAGVSLAGALGTWLSRQHGDRLVGVVTIASAAWFGKPDSWLARASRVRAEGTQWLVESRFGTWFTHEFAARQPSTVAWLLDMLRTTPAEGYASCCEAIAAFDLRDRLGDISVPTLVIAGEEDPATTVAMCRELAEGIPGASLVVIPEASHFVNVERPDAVTHLLLDHLARSAGDARERRR